MLLGPLCELPLELLLLLAGLCLRLGAHNAAAPVDPGALVVACLCRLNQLGKLSLVLALHAHQSKRSGGLLMDDRAQASLALQGANDRLATLPTAGLRVGFWENPNREQENGLRDMEAVRGDS